MTLPSADTGTLSRVKHLAGDVVELAQVRFELFTLEAKQEAARLVRMLVLGALALVGVSFGLIFLAIFLTVLLWDSQRLVPLGIFTGLFLGGGIVAALVVWQQAKQASHMFGATREELHRDRERLSL